MSKWADYGISAVRYNSAHTHIDRVRAISTTVTPSAYGRVFACRQSSRSRPE